MPHSKPNVRYSTCSSLTNDEDTNPAMARSPPRIAVFREPKRSHKVEVMGANRNIIPRPMDITHAVKGKKGRSLFGV